MKHKHWSFLAFDQTITINQDERFLYAVEVNIESAVTELDAMIQAKKIIKRKNYILRSVKECSSCKLNQAMTNFYKKETGEEEI